MTYIGGSKASSAIHDRVVERLHKEFKYTAEEAAAVKSLLYDLVKEAAAKSKKPVSGMDKAKMMEKALTQEFIKDHVTAKMIKDRVELITKIRSEKSKKAPSTKKVSSAKKAAQAAGAKKKASKKSSKKKASKKSSKKKASKKTSKKKASKKTSKKKV